MAGKGAACDGYKRCNRLLSNEIDYRGDMSENYCEIVQDDEILEEAIKYVIAGSKGNQYKYPEGWDKNMKRSVRKRADRVVMRGVEVMYKKKNSDEVRIIQSREEQMRILEMCHSDPTSGHCVKCTGWYHISCVISISCFTSSSSWRCPLCL